MALHAIELSPQAYLRERGAIRALCRRLRPDVFHTHGHRPDVVDSGVARRLGIPTITTMHGFFHAGDWKGKLTERLQLAAFRRFDAVVAVSRALRDDLCARGVPSELITAIPNAWYSVTRCVSRSEARRTLGISESELVIGWVGRVTRQKALDVAITALAELRDTPVVLSLVGDGEERHLLEKRAQASGLQERVRWHGMRDNASALIRAFDVFLLCSRWEGTPIALLEAVLVRAEDPQALAEAIRGVLRDPEAAAQRAEAALLRLQNDFGVGLWLDRYDALYGSLLRRR